MSCEYKISTIEDKNNPNFGNSLIKTEDKTFIRRLDQSKIEADRLIAKDDGVPTENLNIEELIKRANGQCSGTYSYTIHQNNGETTRVAVSKE